MEHTQINPAKIFVFFLFCGLFPIHAQLQNSQTSQVYTTTLFKLSSPEVEHSSYIFGTHHAFGKDLIDSLPAVLEALRSSHLMIKENLNIPGQMAADIINQRATKTKWTTYLNKSDLLFVQQLFAASPTDYRKMSPTELYTFLNRYYKQQICLNQDSGETALSLDDYLGSRAEEMGIPLLGLETTAQQIELINKDVEGLPRKKHKRRLAQIITMLRTGNKGGCAEIQWYQDMEFDYQLSSPCRNNLVLTARNRKWMETIEQALANEACFIAVGLSHLMYNCSLINQLKALGYNITPIPLRVLKRM